VLGSTVIGGMIAASAIAIFLIPVAYAIEHLFSAWKSAREQEVAERPLGSAIAAQRFGPKPNSRVTSRHLNPSIVCQQSARLCRSRLDNVNGSFRGTAAIASIVTLWLQLSVRQVTPRTYQQPIPLFLTDRSTIMEHSEYGETKGIC
jgi:hypothetical protein